MDIVLSMVTAFALAILGTALGLTLAEFKGAVETMIRDLRHSAAPRPSSNR